MPLPCQLLPDIPEGLNNDPGLLLAAFVILITAGLAILAFRVGFKWFSETYVKELRAGLELIAKEKREGLEKISLEIKGIRQQVQESSMHDDKDREDDVKAIMHKLDRIEAKVDSLSS